MDKRKALGWSLVSLSTISLVALIGIAIGYQELVRAVFIFLVVFLIAGIFICGLELLGH